MNFAKKYAYCHSSKPVFKVTSDAGPFTTSLVGLRVGQTNLHIFSRDQNSIFILDEVSDFVGQCRDGPSRMRSAVGVDVVLKHGPQSAINGNG
jgi:hypothetical protein